MQWQGVNAVNAMKFLVVLYLQHFLSIDNDNKSLLASRKICSYMNNLSGLSKSANLATGIAVDIPKSTVDSRKAMQKLACNGYKKTCCDKDYGNIGLDINLHAPNLVFAACFKPSVSVVFDFKNLEFLNQSMSVPIDDCHVLTNLIHQILPLNFFQQFFVKRVMHHVIRAKNKPPSIDSNDQIFFYVCGADGVEKSSVIKAIKTEFSLLQWSKKLLITASTRAVASEIGGSTVHATMGIKIRGKKLAMLNANGWTWRTLLIVNKVSMISLKLLASMDSKIWQAKSHDQNLIALFGGFSLVIFMGDFFQFTLVDEKPFWDNRHWLHTGDKKAGKKYSKISPCLS